MTTFDGTWGRGEAGGGGGRGMCGARKGEDSKPAMLEAHGLLGVSCYTHDASHASASTDSEAMPGWPICLIPVSINVELTLC